MSPHDHLMSGRLQSVLGHLRKSTLQRVYLDLMASLDRQEHPAWNDNNVDARTVEGWMEHVENEMFIPRYWKEGTDH
ncbi:hypothetical protein JQ543_13735 [Bradyrhizobium diazoefficiens]|nr:hypothetical protein [Bradyrhizobium diazoefficiens]MBR0848809.1 hypothetical protein [Bradyrhizobium diazoefficiens]